MKDYIALVTVELREFARQIAGGFIRRLQRSLRRVGPMSVMAFHEKAGRSQGDSGFMLFDPLFFSPVRRCRHASIRTLEERFGSLGSCWAFSFQPVLPSD
jgi:hypothetical protein